GELEQATGARLYHEAGLLIAGPGNGEAVPGARLAATKYGIAIEDVSPQRLSRDFPWMRLRDELEAVFEPEAGFLEVERCVELQVREGERLGGRVVTDARVVNWSVRNGTVEVTTDCGRYSADRVVITAGPWASQVLADARLPLEVVRKPVAWFPHDSRQRPECGFFVETEGRAFYGVPGLDGASTKVAEHTGGRTVDDPSQLDRQLHADDLGPLQSFLAATLPGLRREPVRSSVCMYTLTPDRHFLIDLHPDHRNVAIACGFSGHGFKFAPVVGEVLTDLATTRETLAPIGFLRNRWPSSSTEKSF
ncbi:MAG TPA: N-methyl-L-tryptophan oxidase, partial [Caulifigura sp.]|nr:N-methyl-L-tryptophan oxidase [Caulifigura sp.]